MNKFLRLLLIMLTVQVFPACNLSYADICVRKSFDTEIPQDSTKTADTNNVIYVSGGEILSIVPGTISNIKVVIQKAAVEKSTKTFPKPAAKIALHTTKKTVAKPVTSGLANFALNLDGKNCTFTASVDCPTPIITSQPTSAVVTGGGSNTFSVSALGTGLTYQ